MKEHSASSDFQRYEHELVWKILKKTQWMEWYGDHICYSWEDRKQIAEILLWAICEKHHHLLATIGTDEAKTEDPGGHYFTELKNLFLKVIKGIARPRKELGAPRLSRRTFTVEELDWGLEHDHIPPLAYGLLTFLLAGGRHKDYFRAEPRHESVHAQEVYTSYWRQKLWQALAGRKRTDERYWDRRHEAKVRSEESWDQDAESDERLSTPEERDWWGGIEPPVDAEIWEEEAPKEDS